MFTVLATLFSAASIVAADLGTCARSYTVKEGDYCDGISAAQNSSTYQLAVSNYQTINDGCTNIMPDQVICLGIQNQDCKNTYVTKDGDYCDLIAGYFGINSTLLMTNNPQIDDVCSNLYIGEVLCVANTALVTPAPAGWISPGSNLDDGSFEDPGSSGASSATVTPAATNVTTTSAVATTTSAPVANGPVDNAAAGPASTASASNDNSDDCDDGSYGNAGTGGDDDDDDDSNGDDDDDCD